jgi:thioredoxin-related protein
MRLSSVAHCHHVLLAALLLLSAQPGYANEAAKGAFIGARSAEKPDWFKESFLEFEEDVREATAAGRRVMLYFHQDGCPYCARLVEENFANPEIRDFIVQNFDGISLNLWGDRDVVSVSGRKFTEKAFAAALEVQYTPTLIFLDERGQVALRLNGYYPPLDFRAALSFVAQKLEAQTSFAEYRLQNRKPAAGKLIEEDFYLDENDLGQLLQTHNRPLAVYFEAANCVECEVMHQRILRDPATLKLVRQASNVQLDIGSQQPLTTPDGRQTTAQQWATELGIAYTPSLVFFDTSGQQVMRIDAFLKTFHFQSVYAYVLEQAYLETPQFQRYISARADRIREAGHDTDIWGYDSFHD